MYKHDCAHLAGLAALACAVARALASTAGAATGAATAATTGLLVSSPSSCSLLCARSGGLTQPAASAMSASHCRRLLLAVQHSQATAVHWTLI